MKLKLYAVKIFGQAETFSVNFICRRLALFPGNIIFKWHYYAIFVDTSFFLIQVKIYSNYHWYILYNL